MRIGPVKFEFGGNGPNGVWYRNSDGTEQNVTIPAVAAVAVVLVLFCCCARLVF